MEERVVEAKPAGPDQHGALEQRRHDGGRGGGGVEGERRGGSAPWRDRARERGKEWGLRRWEGAEGEGAWRRGDGGGWTVEEVGEHGDWRYGLSCSVRVLCARVFGASVFSVANSPCRIVDGGVFREQKN